MRTLPVAHYYISHHNLLLIMDDVHIDETFKSNHIQFINYTVIEGFDSGAYNVQLISSLPLSGVSIILIVRGSLH